MIQKIKLFSIQKLKSTTCDYNDAFLLVRGNTKIAENATARIAFKSSAPFTKCITKIDGTKIDETENIDLVMLMYDLFEYRLNYSNTAGSIQFYFKDDAANFNKAIAPDIDNFKSFKYKIKLIGSTAAKNGILEDAAISVPIKRYK